MKATDIYSLFEAQQELFEVEMSPSNLKRLAAAIPGVKVGMEFEMVVPGAKGDEDDDYYEREPDYDRDERVEDIEDIVRFFGEDDDYMGQMNSPGTLDRLRDELYDKFYEWRGEKISNEWRDSDGKEFFAKWVKENVDPDEVAEFAETPEDLFGERNPTKDDYEKFIEDQWDTEGSYYDEAYEAFREDRESDGDHDESEFLSDIGIRYMSHVENNVNVDLSWPYYEDYYGGDGEDIESVGDDFSDAIGKPVYSSTSYHGARRAPGAYSLEPDGSIDAGPGEAGLEFVSPPMPVDEMLEDLENVKEWADNRGAYTNSSTGLHINVSIPNYSRENLDFVKLAVLLGDRYVLEQFGRLSNSYAESALNIIQNRAKDNEDVDRLLNQLKTNVETIASKLLHSGRTDKYTSINTKENYVEFRSAGGDWLNKNFLKIENTLLRFIVALDAACDPNKYKKEYLKGLYKVLKPKDPKSDMSMFARYMAGEITRSEYANSLESKRKERFKGQGIKVLHKDEVDEGDWVIEYDDGKKKDVMYIAKTEAVPTDGAAWKAAQKFKPNWFKPDSLEYITVAPFKFGEELDDLKMYRAEYGHKYVGVVAPDEEWAEEYVRLMDPEYFAAYPDVQITLHDVEEPSKRKISQMSDWQAPKVAAGYEWNKRPKIWRATGRSSQAGRYYIAAVSRDEAIDVAKRLDPDMAESDNFEIYVNDSLPGEDTYNAYVKAQEDLIQQRERDAELLRQQQAAEESDIDISNLKVYRVSSMNGYRYVVAENGAEAAELATELAPEMFARREDLTVQDQSNLASTSNPSLIKSMYHSQQQTLNSRRDNSRGQVDNTYQTASGETARLAPGEQLYLVRNNDTGHEVRLAAGSEQNARGRAIRNDPHNFTSGADITVTLLRRPPPAVQGTMGTPEPAFGQSSTARISDLRRYMVTNNDDPNSGSVTLAATSIDDAINRAREAQPAWSTAGLYARPID